MARVSRRCAHITTTGRTKISLDPASFWALARSYLAAADRLLVERTSEVYLPAAYLLCHALELALKAYLLHAGVSVRLLKEKYRHDLKACLAAAEQEGLGRYLTLSAEEHEDIKQINEYYARKELEYAFGKEMTFPPIERLRSTVDRSLTAIFNPLTEDVFRGMSGPD